MSRTVIPRAYMDRIFSSNPVNRVCPLATIFGSNVPFRSRGVSSSNSPQSPFNFLQVFPFRELPLLCPARIVLFVAEVILQLGRHGTLQQSFCQLLQQPILSDD